MNNIVWLYFELQGSLFKLLQKTHNNIYKLQLKIQIRDQQAFIRKIKKSRIMFDPQNNFSKSRLKFSCLRISRVPCGVIPGWKTLC